MKIALLFFLLGLAAGAIGMGLYAEHDQQSIAQQARSTAARVADHTKAAAGSLTDSLAAKLDEWHLTPNDITADLAKTGRVVRERTAAVGETISDARILSVIKAKYVLDRGLSARSIDVDVKDGAVELTGTVDSPELVGRAVALALDTDGVHHVTSRLAVAAPSK